MQPELIITPFGESADPETIREIPQSKPAGAPRQNASWDQGFPIVTMTPIAAGGIPPEGPDMNGVLRAISRHTSFTGGGGQYKWSAEYVAAKGGYPKGAVIQADNGESSYVSMEDGNTTNFNAYPDSIGKQWEFFGGPSSYFKLQFEKEQQQRNDAFNQFLAGTAFEMPPIPFVDGTTIEISRPTQLVSYEGNLYSVKMPSTFPVILPGIWSVAQASLTPQTDPTLRQQLAASAGSGLVGFNRNPIGMAVGSLAKIIPGIPISLWEYENYVTSKPNPTDVTTWDWTPAVIQMFAQHDGVNRANFNIPFMARCGNIRLDGKHNWSISGTGGFVKTTKNSQFEIYRSNDWEFRGVTLNGNIVWDEATNGSIIPGGTPRVDAYAVGIYAQDVNRVVIDGATLFGFAQDPISIRGQYLAGSGTPGSSGATLVTASTDITVRNCVIRNYRNTGVLLAGIHGGTVTNNWIGTTDDFGYIRGNGVYTIDWCEDFDIMFNDLHRIGDNSVGVGEVGNPIAQNKRIRVLYNYCDRSVFMSILVSGAEDTIVEGNYISRGMMEKVLEPLAITITGNPGSLQVKGGNTSRNKNIQVVRNTVVDSYKRGINVFDDAAISEANWTPGVTVEGNYAIRSALENIYVNMPLQVDVKGNYAIDGSNNGIFTSGPHNITGNHSTGNTNHGIFATQLLTFSGAKQKVLIALNECLDNGGNGIQTFGLSASRQVVTQNKANGNGRLGTTLGGKGGIRLNGVFRPHVAMNDCDGNYGPGIVFQSCTNFTADSNLLTSNGLDTTLAQAERAGIYVICTATAFKVGKLMSNIMIAGANQQTGYAAQFDTAGSCVCIGNEPDLHPLPPQNFTRKTWLNIFNNE